MRPIAARLLVGTMLTALVACTTVHPVLAPEKAPLTQASASAAIKLGEPLTITRTDGSVVTMVPYKVLPDGLEGKIEGGGELAQVKFEQIGKIERREVDGIKISILAVGVVLVLSLIVRSLVPDIF